MRLVFVLGLAFAGAVGCSSNSAAPAPQVTLSVGPTGVAEGSPITLTIAITAGSVVTGTVSLGTTTLDMGLTGAQSSPFTIQTWAPAVPTGGGSVTIAVDVADATGRTAHAEAPLAVSNVGKVRLFAMGWHMHIADGFSPAAFDAAMQSLVDAATPDLATDRPNLLVFPEHVGLVNILGSSRATMARQENQLIAALGDLTVAYGKTLDTIESTYDVSYARGTLLAATDTMWRPFVDTFSRLAQANHVFIAATTDVADVVTSTDPAQIALFGDPGLPPRTSVYAPVDGNVYNQTVLFGPDGRIIGHTHKVNLVPLEIQFQLSPGSLDDVQMFDLPVGKLGVAISLDAFTPSYVSKVDSLGAEIVIQNDANDGAWCGPGATSDWQPQEWLLSVLGALGPSYTNLKYDVCPMMTGNLFDLPFDGQTTITMKDPGLPPAMTFVGVDVSAYPGKFLAVGPWVIDDPGKANPALTLAQRRATLAQKSADLLPSGDSPDGYLQTVVHADVDF